MLTVSNLIGFGSGDSLSAVLNAGAGSVTALTTYTFTVSTFAPGTCVVHVAAASVSGTINVTAVTAGGTTMTQSQNSSGNGSDFGGWSGYCVSPVGSTNVVVTTSTTASRITMGCWSVSGNNSLSPSYAPVRVNANAVTVTGTTSGVAGTLMLALTSCNNSAAFSAWTGPTISADGTGSVSTTLCHAEGHWVDDGVTAPISTFNAGGSRSSIMITGWV